MTLAVALFGLVLAVLEAPRWWSQQRAGIWSKEGMSATPVALGSNHLRVTSVEPGGPAARGGFAVGDIIERRHTSTVPMVGETFVRQRIAATGERQAVELIADPEKMPPGQLIRRWLFAGFPLFLFLALLVAWRGARDRAEHALALAMACAGQTSAYALLADEPLRIAGQCVWVASLCAGPFFLTVFVRDYVRSRTGSALPRRPLAWLLLSCVASAGVVLFGIYRFGYELPAWSYASLQYTALSIETALIVPALRLGWRLAEPQERQRIRWIALAAALLLLGDFVGAIPIAVWLRYLYIGVASYALKLLGALVVVWAVLRHRVLDFGFAVNRATVFAATSLLLVGLFAALTALVDRVLHIDDGVARSWTDIAITFALAIVATRLRKLVESAVERILFRDWRAREQALHSFVQRAPHFTRPDPLLDALVGALDQFAGGEAASVLLQRDGMFVAVRDASGRIAPIDIDDPLAVALRAERRAVVLEPARAGAVVALPMSQGGTLFGFVLLGPRAGGEVYRPDEIALLQNVVREVGFDLQALQTVQLSNSMATEILARLDALESSLHGEAVRA